MTRIITIPHKSNNCNSDVPSPLAEYYAKQLQKRSKKKIRIGDNFGNFQYFKEAFKTKSTLHTKLSQ